MKNLDVTGTAGPARRVSTEIPELKHKRFFVENTRFLYVAVEKKLLLVINGNGEYNN